MGMAASQARLLAITARIHDVEYQAQSIENAKLQLATQSDRAYEDYLEALDATTLTLNVINMKSAEESTVTATFNNMCGRNRLQAADGSSYALKDRKGRLIVPQDVYNAYTAYKSTGQNEISPRYIMSLVAGNVQNQVSEKEIKDIEKDVYNKHTSNKELVEAYEAVLDVINRSITDDEANKTDDIDATTGNSSDDSNDYDNWDKERKEEYATAYANFMNILYSNYASEIYEEANKVCGTDGTAADFEKNYEEEFGYYQDYFKQIEANGGRCVSIEDFNEGSSISDVAGSNEWLCAMVSCGAITIHNVEADGKGGVRFDGTSPSSDISLQYTPTTEIDKTELKRAEAKYEKALSDINQKDKRFDLSLSKLESERTALTTEYDSVKKVIEDNIERTFGIFS